MFKCGVFLMNICCVLFLISLQCGVAQRTYCVSQSQDKKISRQDSEEIATPAMSAQRLTALRALMAAQPKPLAAYIIPTADAHNSEYIADCDARRQWLTGFSGSAGTAVVYGEGAMVWTDGRYYTQFQQETEPKLFRLMKQSLPETPTIEKWLTTNLIEGAAVGVDPTTMRRNEWKPIKSALKNANMELIPTKTNLVDEVRNQLNDPAPARPSNAIVPLPVTFTGKSAGAKIKELRAKFAEKKVAALVVTALDEVAYVLNLRGSDIEYNPVFFSYLVITETSAILFTKKEALTEDVSKHFRDEGLDGVSVRGYDEVFTYLETLADQLSKGGNKSSIWLSHDASEAIHIAASGGSTVKEPLKLVSEVSPVAIMKLVKNEVELKGFRECHIRDGIAVVRFFRWLHEQVDAGCNLTEVQASDKLLEFRKQEEHFMGPSFSTIPGAGEHGAIIHYTASRLGEQRVLRASDMFLLDSGGQYKDGTTDITRTRHMSAKPTQIQKDNYTRVLKGQIAIGAAIFPKGVKGNVLDTLARKALWDVGLDYAHGTGHGVGHYLNVHEGPSGVSWRPYPDDPGLGAGIVLSNEPGYYEVGEYGIRHEDLVEIINVTRESEHPRAKDLVGDFNGRGVLGFSTLTMVPNQREAIETSLLTDFELNYTNDYHKKVLNTLGPILKQRGLIEDYNWLVKECQPLTRNQQQRVKVV